MSRRTLRSLDTGDIVKLLEGDESDLIELSSDDDIRPDPDLACYPRGSSDSDGQMEDTGGEDQLHDVGQPETAYPSRRLQRTYRWRKKTFEPTLDVQFTCVLPQTHEVSELGVTGDLVMQLASTLPFGVNHKLFADNYFSSIPIVQELQARGIQYLGTVRGNRLKGCAMKDEKTLKSEGRGCSDHRVEEQTNCVAVRWYDNRVVNLLSSYVGTEPTTVAKRWDRKKKVHVEVPMPAIVQVYNKFMGGIDLLDMMTSMYKYCLKSRRWYLYVFWHTVTIALVNAWLLYRRHQSQQDQDQSR